MCGIVGYVGSKEAYPIIIKGLKRLEYRGYDSAGVAIGNSNGISVIKQKGKVADLEAYISDKNTNGSIGIGHTRWATHGVPNQVNAHPHTSGDGKLSLIHNGIIENYDSIKKALMAKGHAFESDTDTEVLVHLIEEIKNHEQVSLFEAVRIALTEVVGAYAIIVMEKGVNNEFIAARKGSPLLIGVGRDEYYVASDATPIIEYTNEVVYLEDGEIARLNSTDALEIKTIANEEITPYIHELKLSLDTIEKAGFPHFMLKEIHEQPKSILDTMRGRIDPETKEVKLGGILDYEQKIINADRIIIVACGTSWHAGLIGEHLIEDLARIPVEVEYASEFRYRNPIIRERDVVLAISQSGETADTLAAIELAKEKGATVLGICNVAGSSIPRMTHAGIYTHAGPEIGVASTKAFTTQLTALAMLVVALAKHHGAGPERERTLVDRLVELPGLMEKTLTLDAEIRELAKRFADKHHALFLGRGTMHPIAMEGALKLKEISYIHAEAYAAGELKHGPLALVDAQMPVIAVAPNTDLLEKLKSNLMEVRARGGELIVFADPESGIEPSDGVTVITMPRHVSYVQAPAIYTIPLQLLSYHVAILKGTDVDQPRNLAKSVTVE